MKFSHHDFTFEIDDAWWTEAGMKNFIPQSKTYRPDRTNVENNEILEIDINDISPDIRNPGVPAFNDCPKTGIDARTRVINILRGFVDDNPIIPVEIEPNDNQPPFRMRDGAHRLYCSLAAGFTHVPAIKGFDYGKRD